jgi:ABC-type Fe3+ transport system permease subunit
MHDGARGTTDRSVRGRLAFGRAVAASLLTLLVACVLAPVALGVFDALSTPPRTAPTTPPLGASEFSRLGRSLLIACGIAALATVFAIPAALALRRRSAFFACFALTPLLLPSYLAYAAWGTLRTPGTIVGSWLAEQIARDGPRFGPLASHLQAFLGLALWAWPIALIPMLIRARTLDDDALDAAAQLSPSHARRTMLTIVALRPAALFGFALVVVVMLGSAIPLHLANVDTYAIAVWRKLELTAGARAAWITASPLLALSAVAGLCIGLATLRARIDRVGGRHNEPASSPLRSWALWLAVAVFALSTLVPMIVLAVALREPRSLALFWAETGGGMDLLRSLALAGVVALLGAMIALLTSASFSCSRRSPQGVAASIAIVVLLALAFTPGVLIGSAILRASNTDATAFLSDTPIGLVLAHLARFGAVAALAGWFLARCEPVPLRDARLLDDPSLTGWVRAALLPQIPGLLAAGLAVGALSIHEIEAAALLSPPGLETFPRRTLSMLHYLRMEELTAAMLWTLALGLTLSITIAALSALSARAVSRLTGAARIAPLLLLALIVFGCSRPPQPGEPVRVITQFGETGDKPGQLAYPRAIDADTVHTPHSVWIADRTGRVQRFGLDGEPLAIFSTPESEIGKPVGVTVASDGLLYIADTHYHRVLIYETHDTRAEPTLAAQFGSYGTGPGEFIYPTDVAVVPSSTGDPKDARFFVSEYGGNDRVSCFDGEFTFLFSFGREGSGASPERIEFQRPQSLVYDPKRDRLFVTDSGNHRIGVFRLNGTLERWIGDSDPTLGAVPGDPTVGETGGAAFNFPYGLAAIDPSGGGDLLVVEYAACRVQRVNPDSATTVSTYGKPGRGPGELVQPWGVAVADGIAYLLDSRNNRVVSFRP